MSVTPSHPVALKRRIRGIYLDPEMRSRADIFRLTGKNAHSPILKLLDHDPQEVLDV